MDEVKDLGGRPREYNREEVTQAICERLATGREPMSVICKDLGVPVRTVNDWRKGDDTISVRFDEARELGYDAIASDCLAIADDGSRDYMQLPDGREVPDYDHISRSKLRIDT